MRHPPNHSCRKPHPGHTILIFFAAFLLLGTCTIAYAYPSHEIALPNGEYTESHTDLSVKVLGGEVQILRTWRNGRWYLNPAWSALKFTYDHLDNSVMAIDRAGAMYLRSGETYRLENNNRYTIIKTAAGWRWLDYRGNWIDYTPQGNVTAYGDSRPGIKVQFDRDAVGSVTQIKDAHGNIVLSFNYQGGLVSSIRDRAGREVHYTYVSGPGLQLQQVTDARGNVWRYIYDNNGQLISTRDPEDRSTMLYHSLSTPAGDLAPMAGKSQAMEKAEPVLEARTTAPKRDFKIARVGSVTDTNNTVIQYNYQYNQATRRYTVTITDGEGRVTKNIYDADGKLRERYLNGRLVHSVILDSKTHEILTDERGLVTHMEYDGMRNLLRISHQDGSSESYTYDAYGNRLSHTNEQGIVTRYQYDPYSNLIKETEAEGTTDERITTYTYDGYDSLTITRKGTGSDPDASIVLTYDSYGNITSHTDPEGNKTTYTHDVAGDILSETSPLGTETRYTYDAQGNLTGATRAYGKPEQQTTAYGYDKIGNWNTETNARGKEYRYGYNPRNLPFIRYNPDGEFRLAQYDKSYKITRYADEDGRGITYNYDREGRLSSILDDNGNAVKLIFAQTQADHALGSKPLRIEYPTFVEHYKYDPRNRVVMQTASSGDENLTQRYGYNATGAIIESTDANGNTTYYEYDALNRLTQITDRIDASISVTYDSRDNVTSYKDGRGNTTRYTYDRANRLTQIQDAQGRITQYTWDKDDRLARTDNPNGSRIEYAYDALDRITKSIEYTGSTPYKTTTFTYDASNNLTGWSDGVHTATLTYDDLDQLLSEHINYGGFSLGYTTTYTRGGMVNTMTGPDGVTVTYTYDASGKLTGASLPGQGDIQLENYQWQKPRKATYPGAITQTLSYDPFQKMTQLSLQKGAEHIGNLDNQYDLREQLTQKTVNGQTKNYTYNEAQRLQSVSGAEQQTYVTDAAGNRTQSNTSAYTYNNLNQLTRKDSDTYDYDASGNLTKHTSNGTERNYKYDAYNRLIEVAEGNNTLARYGYSPMDYRLWKEIAGEKTWYLYAAQGLIAEADNAGQLQATYGWEPQEYNSTAPLYIKRNGHYAYIHYDDLGTPFKATDANGNTVWSAHYDSFGKASIAETSTITLNLRFPGQYYDEETGLHYNDRRYYDPDTGRYLTQDPLGQSAGQNLYLYVDHDPINLTDPTGEIAPVAAAYARCVLQCAGMTCLEGLITGGGCSPCEGASECFVSCLNPMNWLGGGKGKMLGAVKPLNSRKFPTQVRKDATVAATGRDGIERCKYCGKPVTPKPGSPNSREYDHVVPYSQGGSRETLIYKP